jgi:chromosome partitioning protein
MASKKKPFVPVVAVLNMKGGVGKTIISSNVFRVMFQRQSAGTLLLDLDPQFNLSQALFRRDMYDKLKTEGKTILGVMEPASDVGLFDVAISTQPPPNAKDIGVKTHYMTNTPTEELRVVPGDFGLIKYTLMDDNKKLASA